MLARRGATIQPCSFISNESDLGECQAEGRDDFREHRQPGEIPTIDCTLPFGLAGAARPEQSFPDGRA